jgi:hypothetical protein
MDPKEKECEDVDWIQPVYDSIQLWAPMNTTMNLRIPQDTKNYMNR